MRSNIMYLNIFSKHIEVSGMHFIMLLNIKK